MNTGESALGDEASSVAGLLNRTREVSIRCQMLQLSDAIQLCMTLTLVHLLAEKGRA